jgi:uncharacterized Tic20 family protein
MDELTPPSAPSRQWAMLAHLLTLLGYLIGIGHFIPPLVIWLAKRDEDEFVGDQAKESLNFQITYLLVSIVAAVLIFVLIISCVGIPVAWLIGLGLPIAHLVLVIIAGLKASDGVRYRYPVNIRFF